MKKIQGKGYVNNVKGSLIPTLTGYAIVQFLEKSHIASDLYYEISPNPIEDEITDNVEKKAA